MHIRNKRSFEYNTVTGHWPLLLDDYYDALIEWEIERMVTIDRWLCVCVCDTNWQRIVCSMVCRIRSMPDTIQMWIVTLLIYHSQICFLRCIIALKGNIFNTHTQPLGHGLNSDWQGVCCEGLTTFSTDWHVHITIWSKVCHSANMAYQWQLWKLFFSHFNVSSSSSLYVLGQRCLLLLLLLLFFLSLPLFSLDYCAYDSIRH